MSDRRAFLRDLSLAWGAGLVALADLSSLDGCSSDSGPLSGFHGSFAGEQRNVAGIPMCWCPPGRFVMGSPPSERGRRADEAQVSVVLTRGFWIGKYEVTQAQWAATMREAPERPLSSEFGLGDRFPVYWITFGQAERFCAMMNAESYRSQALPSNWEFRLPTEAQWEYACRAGTTSATSFGDEVRPSQVNFGWDNAAQRRGAAPAGSFPPNPWGICEMHGNVWEWCRDWYHTELPGGTDPDLYEQVGLMNGDGTHSRVRRGGAWIEESNFCRSAARLRYEPHRSSDHIGFRVTVVPRS